MISLRRAIQSAALFLVVFLLSPSTLFCANVLSRDDTVSKFVPAEAYQRTGLWENGDYWITVGHSTEIDALGKAKGKRLERDFAEDESKALMLKQAALLKNPEYDADSYDLKGEIIGFQTAATYRLNGKSDFYLIGLAKKSGVQVEVVFNAKKARLAAIALFESGKYREAASKLATVTERGIQDSETMDFARAASQHVNLDAGVKGEPRIEALEGLGQFYLKQRDYEASLRHFYDLYLETENPSPPLLENLVMLCEKARRSDTSAKFQKEISRRWPTIAIVPITDANIEKRFEPMLLNQPMLLKNGGASVVQFDNRLYFLAVGVTDVRGNTSQEKLRQLRVGRVQAQKEAVAFAEQTKVVAKEKLVEKTTIALEGQKKALSVLKTIDETTSTKVGGVLKSLDEVGSWRSADRTLFFYAVGKRLD